MDEQKGTVEKKADKAGWYLGKGLRKIWKVADGAFHGFRQGLQKEEKK
jgi:hypothetical protein